MLAARVGRSVRPREGVTPEMARSSSIWWTTSNSITISRYFGEVVSGMDVAGQVAEGDVIVRATVVVE